jgi:hypothetical protein
MLKFWARLFLLLPVAYTCAYGQNPDSTALRGRVMGPDGLGAAGAHVVITDAQQRVLRSLATGQNGEFIVEGLPAQPVSVTAEASGLSAESGAMTLAAGTTATIQLQLHLPTAHAEVKVTGAVGEIRTDEPQLGDHLSGGQARTMPLPNRRVTYLPLLNAANRPAINQGDIFMNQNLFTANGTGRRQTWFEVDGSNGNDMWGRQTIFTNVPLDAIGQMTVLDNAFAADYGFGEGAVVNLVTRTGGAQFHGDVLGLWRPSGPEAALSGFSTTTANSGNDITRDTLDQGAVTAGGPITHNGQTSFLVSGEYSDQDRASPVISPIAPGNYVGHYRDWLGFLRIDHNFEKNQRAFLHLGADAYVDTNPNGIVGGNTLPTVARVFHRKTYTTELGDTAVVSPTLVNEARLQFQLASPITQFSPVVNGTQFVVPISTGGTFTSGTSQGALLLNRQFELVDNVTKTLGRNELRAGFNLIHAHSGGNSKEFGGPIYQGQLSYNTCTRTVTYCESPAYLGNIANLKSYTQSYGNANYVVDDTLAGIFAEYDVHLRSNLTLNFGLRYELQTLTDARDDFSPRIGFAWNVGGRGTTTVRGGFGIYDAQVVDNSEASYALTGPTGVFNYTAAPGQPGFPASVSDVPLPAFPAGAVAPLRSLYLRPGRASYYNQFFPTSTLINYPSALLNPYNEQWTFGLEQQLAPTWILAMDYVGSHTLRIVRPLDLDAPASYIRTAQNLPARTAQAANCTRPYWVAWYAQQGLACDATSNQGKTSATPAYSVIQSDVNDGIGWYDALDVNLSHHARNGSALLASYTWSHTMDTVDPDTTSQNPNDPRLTGRQYELGNAIFDQRNRLVLSGVYAARWGLSAGGIATVASGLPYNIVTGLNNSGDTGATTDRPVINGTVVRRNAGRGTAIYDVEPFVAKRLPLVSDRVSAELRAEAFNVLNHRNVVGFSGTYGNGAAPGPGFGQPLAGVTNQLYPREMQFSLRVSF